VTDKPVDLEFLAGRVIELEAELRKMRRRCRKNHRPCDAIGFKVEDNLEDSEFEPPPWGVEPSLDPPGDPKPVTPTGTK
jgi:hypothetical protein